MLIELGNVIGHEVRPIGRVTSDLVDPATGEIFGRATVSGIEDVELAVSAASQAWPGWRETTPRQRQELLLRFADLIEANADEIVEAEILNTGKPAEATRTAEVLRAVDNIRFFAGALRVLPGAAQAEYAAGFTSSIRREPLGVIAQITPWNFPFMMAVWKVVPAIAAGNTVVLKPAETTPATSVMLGRLALEVFPPGVVNVLLGDRETGRKLVEHPRPAMVSLTGSTRAGVDVMRSAAATLKKVHLELGGKAPAVVFADADLEHAAQQIAEGAFWNAGQSCTAETRVLVEEAARERFTELLVREARRLKTGPPSDPGAFCGPLITRQQFERVSGFLDRLPAHARVLTGGWAGGAGGGGFFLEPTVIDGVLPTDEVVVEEVFGPVLTVQGFGRESEAVSMANATPYGLASSVWTRDQGRSARLAAQIEAGTVWVNCTQNIPSETPHGGYKSSGVGKDLSAYSLEDYSQIKHVLTAHR